MSTQLSNYKSNIYVIKQFNDQTKILDWMAMILNINRKNNIYWYYMTTGAKVEDGEVLNW